MRLDGDLINLKTKYLPNHKPIKRILLQEEKFNESITKPIH